MPEFEYVSKREAQPIKNEVIALIKKVQDYVRNYFTLDYRFVGSSSRNMITREKNGNKGFDFDVNLIPNVYNDEYTAAEIAKIIFNAIQQCMRKYGYTKIEDSTSVITIKVIEKKNSIIEHSCDFAIIRPLSDGKEQYIRFLKMSSFSPQYCYRWELRGGDYHIAGKLQWIIDNNLNQLLRDRYLINKNHNYIQAKKSRAIFAETVNNIYNEYSNCIRPLRYPLY
ncbi:MAG: hypothetical protein Q4A05_04075 [Ruminococcus sp.]|nr:hypothetical protein [Ruminococcus sp.]